MNREIVKDDEIESSGSHLIFKIPLNNKLFNFQKTTLP